MCRGQKREIELRLKAQDERNSNLGLEVDRLQGLCEANKIDFMKKNQKVNAIQVNGFVILAKGMRRGDHNYMVSEDTQRNGGSMENASGLSPYLRPHHEVSMRNGGFVGL